MSVLEDRRIAGVVRVAPVVGLPIARVEVCAQRRARVDDEGSVAAGRFLDLDRRAALPEEDVDEERAGLAAELGDLGVDELEDGLLARNPLGAAAHGGEASTNVVVHEERRADAGDEGSGVDEPARRSRVPLDGLVEEERPEQGRAGRDPVRFEGEAGRRDRLEERRRRVAERPSCEPRRALEQHDLRPVERDQPSGLDQDLGGAVARAARVQALGVEPSGDEERERLVRLAGLSEGLRAAEGEHPAAAVRGPDGSSTGVRNPPASTRTARLRPDGSSSVPEAPGTSRNPSSGSASKIRPVQPPPPLSPA